MGGVDALPKRQLTSRSLDGRDGSYVSNPYATIATASELATTIPLVNTPHV